MLADNSANLHKNDSDVNNSPDTNILDDLYAFLNEAELQHYFDDLKIKLKVRSIAQLKYVDETDLQTIGMTRPEMRRLKKYFAKEFPQTAMGRIKKRLSRTTSCRSTSVPRPDEFTNRINSFSVRQTGNGASRSPRDSDDLATIASVANVSMASVDTSDSSEWQHMGSKYFLSSTQLTLGPLLHHGDIGDLYQGNFRSSQVQLQVALKVIDKITLRNEFKEFVREIFSNCFLDHPNIIKLYGISLDECNINLVSELAQCGSLKDGLLGTESRIKYPVTVLHGFMIQISDAMSYLEERKVIHGRLTGTNVLLFPNNQVKVTDTGLSRVHHSIDRYNDNVSPSLWLAPEIIKGAMETVQSDVWSFGVLLWEMHSYYEHLSSSRMDQSVSSHADMRLAYMLQPDLCPNMVFQVIQSCWTEAAKERPSFYQLSTQLVRLEPERVVALVDGPDSVPCHRPEEVNEPSDGSYSSLSDIEMLYYKTGDIIVVLDRSMTQYKELWRGCLLTGKVGYFKWTNMRAVGVQHQQSASDDTGRPLKTSTSARPSIGETFSKIRISRREERKKVSIDMISGPQNDFRHVGHVGANGDVFGDVTSLYASGAQKRPKSGSVTPSCRTAREHPSEASSVMSSSTLTTTGDETPPYATINRDPIQRKSAAPKLHQSEYKTLHFAQPAPPLPPIRSHSEEESTQNVYIDDFGIGNNYSVSNDSFSLFDELSRHWEMHCSKIESPTSDTVVGTSFNDRSMLSSSSPDRCGSPDFNAGYSEVYNEPLRSMSLYDPLPLSHEDPQSTGRHQKVSNTNHSPLPHESSSAKSSIFQKLRGFGAGKQSRQSKELSDGQASPVYAKLNKATKSKKPKESKESKKNVIGLPVLITGPVTNCNDGGDSTFLDCSSEVSSLQPSPRDSTLCLANGGIMEPSPRINRNTSNSVIPGPRRKMSDSTATTTSVSPASSFASLAPTPPVLQGAGALRALRKGDCVYKATSTVNALNRKRPSIGQVMGDHYSGDGNGSRMHQANLSLADTGVRSPKNDGRHHYVTPADNYEDIDGVMASSATTPVASELLPDLPYIDLSFVRSVTEDRVNPGDEDDAYNSLHSGSGSDTIEPQSIARQSTLSGDSADASGKSSVNGTSVHSTVKENEIASMTTSINKMDSGNGLPRNGKYSFNNSNIFALHGYDDEVALTVSVVVSLGINIIKCAVVHC